MSDLPPLDQPLAWVVVHGNEQAGPYTLDLLITEVVAGRLSDSTPVWWPPLRDWTTIASSPDLLDEIARRRGAMSPGWAPQSTGYSSAAESDQSNADVFTRRGWAQPQPAPAQDTPSVFAMASPTAAASTVERHGEAIMVENAEDEETQIEVPGGADQGSATDGDEAEPHEADIDDAEIVDTVPGVVHAAVVPDQVAAGPATDSATGVISGLEGSVRSDFASVVARSKVRADRLAAVSGVDESLLLATVEAAAQCGFSLGERLDVDRRHELRFNEVSGAGLLVISLAELAATTPDDIASAVLPMTVTVQINGQRPGVLRSEVTGEHGQVTVRPDDWTGQTTSSVSLILGTDDYVDENLVVDAATVQRDVRAVIETVKAALS